MTKTPKDETPLRWTLTDHACRVCFGRVMTRTTFDRRKVYRCACCDTEVEGHQSTVLCACGIKLRNGRDAGIRCRVNTHRTPENPSAIVAEQVDVSQIQHSTQ